MGCTNCTQTTAAITGYVPAYCQPTAPCSSPCYPSSSDASTIIYNGPPLTCSAIATGTALDIILQTIDPLLCAATGDYSTYNTYCLAPITTQQQFVEGISQYVCNTQSQLTAFVNTTFPAYQATVSSQIIAINNPGLTCDSAGVNNTDTLQSVLTKYCSTFANIFTQLNPSAANWTSCYAVSPAPTTIVQGFNVLIAQICLLKASVTNNTSALPLFNNQNSCLATQGTADSLVTTVNSIKTRLCQTGTLDTTAINWGCVTVPNGTQNLQDSLQNLADQISMLSESVPVAFSGDFTVTNVDNSNLCLGKRIALATPSTQDRFVAATTSDLSPGSLQQKVTAGTNITLDYTTIPGQMIINSSGGSGVGNGEVFVDASDSTMDYLSSKLSGSTSNGVTLTPGLDTTNPSHILNLALSVDPVGLFTALLQAVQTNPTLQALFCQTVAACPSPCAPPSNITVTYSPGGGTTTSTSTTTTTTFPSTSTTTSTSSTTSSSTSTTSTSSSSTSSTTSTSTSSSSTTSTTSYSTTTTSTTTGSTTSTSTTTSTTGSTTSTSTTTSTTGSTTSTSTTTSTTGSTTSTSTTTSTTGSTTSTSTTTTTTNSTTSTTSTSTSSTTSTTSTSTSTSTTSTTSSTTTTTTTAAPATIYTGAQSGSTPPNSAAVSAGTATSQVPTGNVIGDFTPFNTTPQYCWCAIPAAYAKTKWYDTSLNNGNIGGSSDLFTIATTVTISGTSYSVYMTQYQTQFSESTQFQP